MPELTDDERTLIRIAIKRAHEIGFTPEPASDVARRLRATRAGAASSAIEDNPLTLFEMEMQREMILQRIPNDVMIAIRLEQLKPPSGTLPDTVSKAAAESA